MKNVFKAILVCIFAAGLFGAGEASAQSISACLITKTDTNPFFVKMKEGAQQAASANGIKLSTFAGKIDGDVEAQVLARLMAM